MVDLVCDASVGMVEPINSDRPLTAVPEPHVCVEVVHEGVGPQVEHFGTRKLRRPGSRVGVAVCAA